MDLSWTAAVSLVLLFLAQGTASQDAPVIQLESVGDTWITLNIRQPLYDSERHRISEYQVAYGTGPHDQTVRTVQNRERDGHPGTPVTLSELEPNTRYTFKVRAVGYDFSKGPASAIRAMTSPRHAQGHPLSRTYPTTMNYREREEMMSAGASLTYHAVTYVVIGLHVILSCVMTS